MLSMPPQATKLPESAYATLITQAERSGMTCTLLPVHVSQMISLPSSEPVTQCRESPAKCTEFTLLIWPLRNFFVEMRTFGASPKSPHFSNSTLVEVRQAARVQQQPAFAGFDHRAVVAQEATAAALVIGSVRVQRDVDRIITKSLGADREPVHVGARLLRHEVSLQLLLVIRRQIAQLPVVPVVEQLVKVRVRARHVKVLGVDQMPVLLHVDHVHEDALGAEVPAHGHIRIGLLQLVANVRQDRSLHQRSQYVRIVQVTLGVYDEQVVAVALHTVLGGQGACRRLGEIVLRMNRFQGPVLSLLSIEECLHRRRVVRHTRVHEHIQPVAGIVQLGDPIEPLLQEWRGLLHKQSHRHQWELHRILRQRQAVLLSRLAISINESTGQIVGVAVQGQLARSIAVHDRGLGGVFGVRQRSFLLRRLQRQHYLLLDAIQILEQCGHVVKLNVQLLAQLLVQVHLGVIQLIVFRVLRGRFQHFVHLIGVTHEQARVQEAHSAPLQWRIATLQRFVWPAVRLCAEHNRRLEVGELLQDSFPRGKEQHVVAVGEQYQAILLLAIRFKCFPKQVYLVATTDRLHVSAEPRFAHAKSRYGQPIVFRRAKIT
uniref:Uncharacterized protein n=1 Tax=Anopheles atroparvus TaxID=41427 RepID=A0A182IQB3_ANOAO